MVGYSRNDILVTTARVALFFTLLFSYPVLFHPTRAAINRLLAFMYSLLVERMTRTQWNGKEEEEFLLKSSRETTTEMKVWDSIAGWSYSHASRSCLNSILVASNLETIIHNNDTSGTNCMYHTRLYTPPLLFVLNFSSITTYDAKDL